MKKGTVKWFNIEKGEGIIVSENNQEFHVTQENVDTSTKTLKDGQIVQFTPVHMQGKFIATQVRSWK